MAKKSFYAVIQGRGKTPTIYNTWEECKKAIDGYKGAIYKGFTTKEEALEFIEQGNRKEQTQQLSLLNQQSALPQVIVYTDGGCLYNPGGPGGYGVVLRFENGEVQELSGGLTNTTNNRMEILAAIKALENLDTPSQVVLHTDSQYLRNAIEQKWVYKWKANNWLRSGQTPAKNRDLWEKLLQLLEKHSVTLVWVKGHAGNPDNERCDQLATLAMHQPGLAQDSPD